MALSDTSLPSTAHLLAPVLMMHATSVPAIITGVKVPAAAAADSRRVRLVSMAVSAAQK